MVVDENLLNKLEKLCAIEIPVERRNGVKSELEKVVSFVEILNELSDIELNFSQNKTPLRDDVPYQDSEIINVILKHSPNSENSFFVVPKIIE
ncbi:MAG: Asp-tRNA(Asn)/Glu-tRNA(Gln) amidotransferase subunit GatC [Campylobacteraceae bacterium]|nr:Asp-tRNA(Asn)/Glu-tRNA(Gln) amidotransferase subunit GatC [Campylobacteraceae bacterium]